MLAKRKIGTIDEPRINSTLRAKWSIKNQNQKTLKGNGRSGVQVAHFVARQETNENEFR